MIEVAVAIILGLSLLSSVKKPEVVPPQPSQLQQCQSMCESGSVSQYKACKCKDKPWEY
jgi:hypothetical protein